MSLPPFHYARELRDQLKISGPVNLFHVIKELGLHYYEEPFESIDGCLLMDGCQARILINSNIRYESRKRFTLAHEIGHFYIPHHQGQMYQCLAKDIQRYQGNKKLENEANEFAAEFLLPASEVRKYLVRPPDFRMLEEISDIYGTSLIATAVRVIELTDEKIALVLSEAGEIKWFKKSNSFPYWIAKGKLHEWTIAHDFFKKGQLPAGAEKILAKAWCQNAHRDDLLIEESVAFGYLGMVLTLLYIPVDEDGNDWEEAF